MKFISDVKKFAETKGTNKILAILIVLAVVVVGIILIAVHASSPYAEVTATSGTLGSNTTVQSNASATNGKYVQFDTTTTPTTGNCATNPPKTSTYSGYTLIPGTSSQPNPTIFDSTSPPPNYASYGAGVQSPGGYIAPDHDVWTSQYLQVQGYSDPNNAQLKAAGYNNVTGAVGAGFDISDQVDGAGGYDICMALSDNNSSWGGPNGMHMVDLMWPADNNWSEGENDMFEGNPDGTTAPAINTHPADGDCNASNPGASNYCGKQQCQGLWPDSKIDDGQPHLYSMKWANNVYTYSLDGTVVFTCDSSDVENGFTALTPTTPLHLSLQMQDLSESTNIPQSSMVTADFYWVAAYQYE